MIVCLLAALVSQGQTPPPSAASLISLMLKHYVEAKTVSGTVRFLQTAVGQTVEVDTQFALERPDLIYVHQVEAHTDHIPVDLVSDGVQFAYTAIPNALSPPKLIETVHPPGQPSLHIGDMYYCILPTLMDRPLPLDIAVGRQDHLRTIAIELASFSLKGPVTLRGIATQDIAGDWRDPMRNLITGTFHLYVTDKGDFVRLERHHVVAVDQTWLYKNHLPLDAYPKGIEVTDTWDADLAVGQPVDRSIFALRH